MKLKYLSLTVIFSFFLSLLVCQAIAAEKTIKPRPVTPKGSDKLHPVNKPPIKIIPKGYCCKDGKSSPSTKKNCQRLHGIYFTTKKEATSKCTGFCCVDGTISKTTEVKCKEIKGLFSSKARDAENQCIRYRGFCCNNGTISTSTVGKCKKERGTFYRQKKEAVQKCNGYCCSGFKVSQVTKQKCLKNHGKFFENKQQANRFCVNQKGYCNSDGKTLRLSEQRCKKKRGLFFPSQLQAKQNLLKLHRQELIQKKSAELKITGPAAQDKPITIAPGNLKLPDLIIRGVDISNKTPFIGEKVKLTATIYNLGSKTASKVLVKFTYQGKRHLKMISRVPKQESASVSVDITIQKPTGSQTIEIYVNPDKRTKESNHNNNSQIKKILVKNSLKIIPPKKQIISDRKIPIIPSILPPSLPQKPRVSPDIPQLKRKNKSNFALKKAPLPLLTLFGLTPNRWQQGSDYTVTVRGRDFTPKHWIRFKPGIVAQTTFKDSTTLELEIKLSDNAELGRAPVQLCTGPETILYGSNNSPPCHNTQLYGWVVESQSLPVPDQVKCEDLIEDNPAELGKIKLKEPMSGFGFKPGEYTATGNATAGGSIGNIGVETTPGYYYNQGVPLLDDQTVFEWEEETTGLAESFEIQFLNMSEEVLKSVTIKTTANITTFKPDPQLIMNLYKQLFDYQLKLTNSSGILAVKNQPGVAVTDNTLSSVPKSAGAAQGCYSKLYSDYFSYMTAEEALSCYKMKYPGVIQLLWRVNGYKKVNICGVTSTGTAIFSKKSIQVETSDFGYLRLGKRPTGTSCEKANGELTASKEMDSTQETDDYSWYPGDTIVLQGKFTLNNSPWHVDGRKGWLPPTNGNGTQYIFNNVFVDWGDGTVKRLRAGGDPGTDNNSGVPDFQSDINLSFLAKHVYTTPGQFQARIFVQAIDDLDTDNTDRMFLVYCNPVDITIVQDIAATGALHLKAINIVSLSSDNNLPPQSQQKNSPSNSGDIALTQQSSAADMVSSGQQSLLTFENSVSTCDAGLWARARLDYYGQGYVRLEWRVDGVLLQNEELKIGPSTLRKELPQNPAEWDSEPIKTSNLYTSPGLPVSEAGSHKVVVSARIISDPTGSTVNSAAMQFRNSSMISSSSYITLQQAVEMPKIGMVDSQVTSPPEVYTSMQNDDPTCNFLFMVKSFGDYFLITNTSDVQRRGDFYSGSGTMIYRLPDTAYSVKEFYQPLNFNNWQAASESNLLPGLEVTQGHLKTTAFVVMDDLPGMKVKLRRLEGDAGDAVNALFDVKVKDTTLRLVDSENSPFWTGLSATLTPEGDWYIDGQTMGLTRIGWSLFNIESSDVRIDLSHRQGSSLSGAKGTINFNGSNTNWVGIHLGSATLYPYTFKLDNNVKIDVQNWGIMEGGLFGSSHGTGFDHAFGDGRIGWDSIDIVVEASKLEAEYTGMFVEMAWPRVRLEGGDTHLSYAPGENASVSVDFHTDKVPHEEYGALSMTSSIKNFEFRKNWGINTDTIFEFFDRKKSISIVPVDDIFFDIFSMAQFANDRTSKTLNISETARIGGAPTTLNKIIIKTKNQKGALDFTLTGTLSLAKIKNFTDVNIDYSTEKNGDQILAAGPIIKDLPPVSFQFPPGLPVMKSTIKNLHYKAGNSQRSAGSGSSCTANDEFIGTMTTKLFNTATGNKYDLTLRFGEKDDNNAYWLAYGEFPNQKVAVYPPYLYITAFKGGMAYNFPAETLPEGTQETACPNDAGLVFSAGIDLSVLEDGVVTGDGILTVAPDDSVYRFDTTKVEVLGYDLDQKSEYIYNAAADSFYGTIFGDFEPIEGILRILTKKNSVSFGVSKSDWHLSLGRQSGPQASISLFANPFNDGYLLNGLGYFEIGSEINGFQTGISADIGVATTGNEPCDKEHANCASLYGKVATDFSGSYKSWTFAHVMESSFNVNACGDLKFWKGCVSMGHSVNIGMGINPEKFGISTNISSIPCYKFDIGIELAPEFNPNIENHYTCPTLKFW